jgi:hypothetical protein
MMAPILFAAAFLVTFVLTRRSLGAGVSAAMTAGYFHGIIRANIESPFTAFMFDASLMGLYIATFMRCPALKNRFWQTPLGKWMILLILWPALVALVPVNYPLVQLVAFHSTVWFALMLAIGTQLKWADIRTAGRWIAILNVVALIVGIYIYEFGVPALYPLNAITRYTYLSRDVANGQWRIPSTFLVAHSYGGAMLMSLPFLASIGFDRHAARDKLLAIIGTVCALGGLLLCGAREPIIVGLLGGAIALIVGRANPRLLFTVIATIGVAVFVASQDERFQRVLTLLDPDLVQSRVQFSANFAFLGLLMKYPFGAGMGSGWGTSIPSFLAEYAPQPIGLENEFSKILINMGIIGLVIWIGFLVWYLRQVPSSRGKQRAPLGVLLAYGMTSAVWVTAWIGAGVTSSVPMSAMMFLLQGVVIGASRKRVVEPAHEPTRSSRKFILREPRFGALGTRRG